MRTGTVTRSDGFRGQRAIRGPWRDYLDGLAEYRPTLHSYCVRLTGNVWDGEDLVQDTLLKVFGLLGRSDTRLENPRAYLIRAASNLWIDRVRRSARAEEATALSARESETGAAQSPDIEQATTSLFQGLHPQERAALVMKEVFDLSLEETAEILGTTVGAVKSALNRARGRLTGRRPSAGLIAPPTELVERFARALADQDIATIGTLCAENVVGELVGGAEFNSIKEVKKVVSYAHMVMPRLGFGARPWWKVVEYDGEPIVVGFRTLDGVEGVNEIHRIEATEGLITRIRTYCFCPETLAVVAKDLGTTALPRPYRSPSVSDVLASLVGMTPRWRRRRP